MPSILFNLQPLYILFCSNYLMFVVVIVVHTTINPLKFLITFTSHYSRSRDKITAVTKD